MDAPASSGPIEAPVAERLDPPPISELVAVGAELDDVQQALHDASYEVLASATDELDAWERRLLEDSRQTLVWVEEQLEGIYRRLGEVADSSLTQVLISSGEWILPAIDEGNVALIAATIPPPPMPLPPEPSPRPTFRVPPGGSMQLGEPMGDAFGPGRMPEPPDSWLDWAGRTPIQPPPIDVSGTSPALPVWTSGDSPTQATVSPSVDPPTTPATTGSGDESSPGRWPTSPTFYVPPTGFSPAIGPADLPYFPPAVTPAAPTPTRGNGASGDGGSGATEPVMGDTDRGAGPPCPPVTVVIQCAPGATAQVVGGQGGQGGQGGDGGDAAVLSNPFFVIGGGGGQAAAQGWNQQVQPPVAAPAQQAAPKAPSDCDSVPSLREMTDLFVSLFERLTKGEGGVCTTFTEAAQLAQGIVDKINCYFMGNKAGVIVSEGGLFRDMFSFLPTWIRWLPEFVISTVFRISNSVPAAAKIVTGCDDRLYPVLALLRGALGAVETWIGASFPEVQTRLDQYCGTLCPTRLPSQDDADLARNLNYIAPDLWVCWTKANGNDPSPFEVLRKAKGVRPNALQTVEYGLKTQRPIEDVWKLLHETGVEDNRYQQWFTELARYVPGPSDLISFMTRDVFNETVVKKYNYDDGFADNYVGVVKQWAYAQGMDEDVFLKYWRAHWHLPSPSQGYEFIHRLRPGRTDPKLVTDKEDVRELLKVADVPEYWRDRLIEVSYHPLTRTDARRAYFIGALSEEETLDAIKDQGYNDRDASLLLRYWTMEKRDWLLRQPWAKAYVRGELTDDELDAELKSRGVSDKDRIAVDVLLMTATARAETAFALKAMRRKVHRGLLDWEEAAVELQRLKMSPHRASQLARTWQGERQAMGRQASTAQLCDWFDRNLIDAREYADALSRLGYDSATVGRILASCELKGADKAAKSRARADRTADAAASATISAARSSAARRNLELARARRAEMTERRLEERVQRRLAIAASRVATALGGTGADYAATVLGFFNFLRKNRAYTRDGASQLLMDVLSSFTGEGLANFKANVEEFLESLEPIVYLSDRDRADQIRPGEEGEGRPASGGGADAK